MTNDKMREAFEAQYSEPIDKRAIERNGEGNYILAQTASDWRAFQAGYQARDAEIAELVGALEEAVGYITVTAIVDDKAAPIMIKKWECILAKHKQENER